MNIDTYLERINFSTDGRHSLMPTAETLRALQVAHLMTVPFENLSIHAQQPIVLDDDALFTKIVTKRRGGFCYEANGLFAALLRSIGFDVAMLDAQVAKENGEFTPNFAHMTLMVSLQERWLVDVGFGDSFTEPLLMDQESEQIQGSRSYQIVRDGDFFELWQRLDGEPLKVQYRFTLQPYTYADYAEMCRYQETSPESHFTKSRICSRLTENGRITLSDMRLITTSGSGLDHAHPTREERTLTSDAEYADALWKQFGIVMDS